MVVVVRHAERAAEPKDDPGLSEAGQARARALAEALADAGVSAVITTELLRTRETAEPLARARGLTPEVVRTVTGSVPAHAQAVAAAVKKHAGGVVLIVGHSNTVPAIVASLGGPQVPAICDTSFSNLFVLTFDGDSARLVRSMYGAVDPACK
jgi:broad specificity phosphatase PhoE